MTNFFAELLLAQNPLILFLLIAWSLIWKGIALWRSARNNQKGWFVALLIINTFGILEILYIFVFSKEKK
jgi:methionyl-tRNA synthetase